MKVNDINVSKLMYVPILFNNATHNEWQDMYKIHKNKISPYKLLNKNSCKKIYINTGALLNLITIATS